MRKNTSEISRPGERLAALERENRIIKKKLERSEANRALLEEALASHMEVLKVRNAEIHEDRNAYRELSDKLRAEIEQEYREKAQVNEKLNRLDRLNLVGEMAASIGHEVRNPLTTVRGYLQFFEGKEGWRQYKDALRLMIEELDRANSIITDYLSLTKNKPVNLQPGNLKKVLLALKPMLDADAIRRGHVLEFELHDTPDILIDENEIRQLIMNLVQNGFEAMTGQGRITVSSLCNGDTVQLLITDSGKGIPPDVAEKLGTPFFTTKDNGSGLGLAVSYRIIERHRGAIRFESSPGRTTVTTNFPIIPAPLAVSGDNGALGEARLANPN